MTRYRNVEGDINVEALDRGLVALNDMHGLHVDIGGPERQDVSCKCGWIGDTEQEALDHFAAVSRPVWIAAGAELAG
jgi:hypothetical protein